MTASTALNANGHAASATQVAVAGQRLRRRRWILAVTLGLTISSSVTGWIRESNAGFPEMVERVGRYCGCSWGDGYHTCHGSGMRPLANLPPKSYPARTGHLGEKVFGCQACQSSQCNGSCDASIASRRGAFGGYSMLRPAQLPATRQSTFYDRFDEYSRRVSFQSAAQEAGVSAVDPILDHETIEGRYRTTHSPRFELNAQHVVELQRDGYSVLADEPSADEGEMRVTPPVSSSVNAAPMPTTVDPVEAEAHADADAVLPSHQLTQEEIQRFRDYHEHRRLEKKYQKYLIDPEQIDPYQTFGGPPVGSEQRRQLDEQKVDALLKERNESSSSDKESGGSEDILPSPSDLLKDMSKSPTQGAVSDWRSSLDRSSQATSNWGGNSDTQFEMDDVPLDELLPAYPEEDDPDLHLLPAEPVRAMRSATDALSQPSPDDFGVASPRQFIRQPADGYSISPDSVNDEPALDGSVIVRQPVNGPAEQVAEVPAFHFIRQPR
ncbi:hypothetical protein [Rhodopirellula halodulae]|uniref:hypothetical protein n=1 Tax=Rhodopirellula halodulae TaxID=2894198 RepID=UPI001E3853A3|nr:hypothetical protein [Rhodopirellula sp. JC737]MCC9654278.1 hypothetical protein [Rhodopirellula sp. JC737]